MPTDIAIIVAGFVAAFTIFGIVLAWAERRTRGCSKAIFDDLKAELAKYKAAY